MSADSNHPADKGTDKQVTKPEDKPLAGAAITSKGDNAVQQRAQIREAIRSHRITTNPDNPLRIDMGNGKIEQDGRPLTAAKTAEQDPHTFDIDYKPQKTGDHSYSLGVNRQEVADEQTPGEKLQNFMKAAAKRATDPEGWKAWAQGEIDKFSGIGAGLNEAKDETKAAVAAGWNAMTDGTIIEFLSQPNAINAPLFKTVQLAFEAMSKDPEAVNKALEALGKVVMKAGEGYGSLPDADKGKVIGKVMFGMINPEGDIKDAEAALKIGDTIGDTIVTHVDKAVMKTIDQAIKTAEHAAKTSPELAQETKQMLYEYLKSRGLSASELEESGEIPKGYFENLAGKGGEWPVLNERPSPDVVLQTEKYSCVSACGEMLSEGNLSQAEFIKQMGAPADTKKLAEILGPPWKGTDVNPESLNGLLNRKRPWAAEMRELQSDVRPARLEPAHTVVVDGLNADGNIMIRDPADGSRYEMTRANFLKHWNLTAVYR